MLIGFIVMTAVAPVGAQVPLPVAVKQQAGPAIIYAESFNGPAGPEWSIGPVSTTPAASCASCGRFLGEFGGQAVTLTLSNVPADRALVLAFDLFILKTWDGDGQHGFGPDIFSVTTGPLVAGAPCIELQNGVLPAPLLSPRNCTNNLLSATFANHPCHALQPTQTYPNAGSPPREGSVSKDTLGYAACGDSIYHLTFVFTSATAPTLQVSFASNSVQGAVDESWGLDNVIVAAV